jgi:hypothetical protein
VLCRKRPGSQIFIDKNLRLGQRQVTKRTQKNFPATIHFYKGPEVSGSPSTVPQQQWNIITYLPYSTKRQQKTMRKDTVVKRRRTTKIGSGSGGRYQAATSVATAGQLFKAQKKGTCRGSDIGTHATKHFTTLPPRQKSRPKDHALRLVDELLGCHYRYSLETDQRGF